MIFVEIIVTKTLMTFKSMFHIKKLILYLDVCFYSGLENEVSHLLVSYSTRLCFCTALIRDYLITISPLVLLLLYYLIHYH